jgi:organic radical activating enzyme
MSRKEIPIFKMLEDKSDFFCPAKWTELFLYLHHGNSNSCHHPIPHKIPKELLSDPFVLHNTPHKLKMQQLMMDGLRPKECHMCWHIEDLDENAISDRITKSKHYENLIENLKVDPHTIPKYIEVVFDNTCNLSCSYCDSGQSSSWADKIKSNPLTLDTDYRSLYSKTYDYDVTEYVDAWNKWWGMIHDDVGLLKFSGGEPLLSTKCWEFLDNVEASQNTMFSINSNFSVKPRLIEKLSNKATKFKTIIIGASIDATNEMAEYSRQGLDYQLFFDNVNYWCSSTDENCKIYLQSTTSVFNVWKITDMFDLSIQLRQQYPTRVLDFYTTIVRFPEFQSINVLPSHLKDELANTIQKWLDQHRVNLTDAEFGMISKLIIYLTNQPEPLYNLSEEQLISDLVKFIDYYDSFSKNKFVDIYPQNFVNWINSNR